MVLASVAMEWPIECEPLQLVSAGSGTPAAAPSIARLGVKYVSIRRCCPHISCHSTIHHPTTIAHCSGPALRECLDPVHGQTLKLQHFCNFSPINCPPCGHPSVCPRCVLRCQHEGAQGGAGHHPPRPGTSHQWGADTSY